MPLCRFGLPEGRAQKPLDERQALFFLDSGAGGADVMMNFSSGTDLDLIDSKRESSISTTVRVPLPAIHIPVSQACYRIPTQSPAHLCCLCGQDHQIFAAGWATSPHLASPQNSRPAPFRGIPLIMVLVRWLVAWLVAHKVQQHPRRLSSGQSIRLCTCPRVNRSSLITSVCSFSA